MKNLFLALVCLFSVRSYSQSVCKYKAVESTGKTLVYPVYHTLVNYLFDDYAKTALAQVSWEYNSDATSKCFKEFEANNTGAKIEIPELDFPSLDAEVLKGLKKSPLNVLSEPGGQFHASTDMINVDYNAKAEIINAIKSKKNLVKIHGQLKFQVEKIKRDVVAEFDCSKNGSSNGVVALHSRLNDLILKLNASTSNQKINRDTVLEDFMGTCLELSEAESRDFKGLSRKVKLLSGKLPLYGNQIVYEQELASPIQSVESTYIEY